MTFSSPDGFLTNPLLVCPEIPIFTCIKSFVFSVRAMLSIPLCPPLPRPTVIFIVPSGISRSSRITIMRFACTLLFTNIGMTFPDRFIMVSGSTKVTFSFPTRAVVTRARCFVAGTFLYVNASAPRSFAICSTAILPAL